jgi:membrane protein implicated in regulation of membrane protease activity
MWKIWMIIALILIGFEFITVGFLLIFFSIGAFFAGISSLFTNNITIQLFVFAISSILSIILIRPFLIRYFKVDRKAIPSAVDAMIGKEGIVVKDITKYEFGQVKVDGSIWTAKSFNDTNINKGIGVYIVSVEGVKLVVTPSNTFD